MARLIMNIKKNILAGESDQNWYGFYAAYVLGRLGPFVDVSQLSRWLEEPSAMGKWSLITAELILVRLKTK